MISYLKKKRYPILMIIIMLIALCLLLMYNNVSSDIYNSKNTALEVQKDDRFEYIYQHLIQFTSEAYHSANEVSNKIEKDLVNNLDMGALKIALDEGDPVYKKQIHAIFRKYTENNNLNGIDNNRNGFIILSGDLLVEEDFVIDVVNYKEPHTVSDSPLHKHKFTDYVDVSYNSSLFINAIWKLKNQDDSIIAIEPYNYLDESHSKITEITYDNLKSIYMTEGLEGLKNYQFLVPVYITDTGDIFGQKDIVEGVPQNTHKIIIIQSFNLYDQLLHLRPNFENSFEQDKNDIINRYDSILYDLNLFGIILILSISILIAFFFLSYNNSIDNEDLDKK